MKKTNRIFAILAVLSLGFLAMGCIDNPVEPEVTDLNLRRCLEPSGLSAKVTKGENVTLTWNVTKDVEQYAVEIFDNSAMSGNPVATAVISASEVPYTLRLTADQTYYYRVKAMNPAKEDSKWGVYEKSIKTYAVKDPLFLEVAGRTSASVTLKWDATVADAADVTHITYGVVGGETADLALTAEQIGAGNASIDGLQPSTEYDFVLCYLSASRGEVDAWTLPDQSGATTVNSVAALQNAITGKAPVIVLAMEGSPYVLADSFADGQMLLSSGVKIIGEESADGTRPVIKGEIHIMDDYNGESLWFEGVEFNGAAGTYGFPFQLRNGGTASLVPMESVTFKNCTLTGYSKGLVYEWGHTMKVGTFTFESCDINNINSDGSGGGDVIDFRGASEVGALNVINNTIVQGMRTFIRLDAGTWGSIKVENNTMMNLCFVDNTNNAGILGLQVKPTEMTFKNNLIIYEGGIAKLTSANTKYVPVSEQSITVANNWFYSLPDGFFTDNFNQASALAGGGKILDEDPCYNAKGGFFNLVNTDAAAAKVGASKWWVEYVEKPEDLTLEVIPEAKTWNFTDAKYFIGEVTKSKVRDGILMGVTDNKLNVVDGIMNFTAATTLDGRSGVPADGYMAFMVDKPGSVYIKPYDEAGLGNHVIIGVGPESGSRVTVKGGAAANADMVTSQKILISDITEPSIVYIWVSGPIGIEKLAWSNDVKQVNTALPAPAPAINPNSVTQGDVKDLTVTWDAVDNAASYSVVFSGKTYPVTEMEYVISGDVVKMLDPGSFTVSVYANPGEDDIYNTESEAGVCAFAVLPAGGGGGDEEFVVASADELLSAISAGKDAITLKFSDTPYEVGAVTLTAPLHLKGQTSGDKKTPITASFTLSGPIGGSVIFDNLEFAGNGASVIIDDKTADMAPVADTIAILNSYIHGTKALYDNSGKAVSDIQHVIFVGNIIDNCSDGADFIDMRAGAHHNFVFVNNTVSNSCRTFVRTDAGHEMNYATIRNNTFYKVATNSSSKDNNGILHIRSAAGAGLIDYKVQNNLFWSILIDTDPSNAAGFPKLKSKVGLVPNTIMNNYFYNCEDREEKAAYSFWSYIDKETSLTGGGAILPADPCKDAANGDFTLVNGVAMNANVGDPRWNPARGSRPTSEITVANTDELLTAISAGKSVITLAEGEYDLTAVENVPEVASGKMTLTGSLSLIGQGSVRFIGGFIFKEGVSQFSASGITFDGNSAVDNVFEVADAAVRMKSFVVRNSEIRNFKNRLFYMNVTASVASVEFLGDVVTGISGAEFASGDFIDVRKGAVTALKVQNCTFANCVRTFTRIDAAVALSSAVIANNTFYNLCYVDSKDNNGIFHIRATSLGEADFIVRSNIFAHMHRAADAPSNAAGYPKIVSTNTASKIPTFIHNYFFDVDHAEGFDFWTKDRITEEVATAGYGVILAEDPFKAAAEGDFTLVNALAASEKVGDMRWNGNYQRYEGVPFEVANAEEMLAAINAGKNDILLTGTEYDLTAVTDAAVTAGILSVTADLTISGRTTCGAKPKLICAFKPLMTEGGLVLSNINLVGKNADESVKLGNMIDIDASAVMSRIIIRNCEISSYGNRLISGSGTSTCKSVLVSGNIVNNFGTGGDFIDFRKGTANIIKVVNNTFMNGIRTFLRVDAAVVCGAVNVENNTFYNLGAVDSKDNNGIMHVRSTTAIANPRQLVVRKNIFASMHRAVETPSNTAAGFPHLLSKGSAAVVPTFSDNIFWDIDETGNYSWWTYMPEGSVAGAGVVLTETPFSGDPTTGKLTVKTAYKGYGDTRW